MKRFFLFIALAFVCDIYAQTTPDLLKNRKDSVLMIHWVDSIFDSLSTEEKIGQLFMPVIEVKNSDQHKEKVGKYIKSLYIGGILYSKGDPISQANLTNFAQENSRVPLLISLDGEWGLSMRLSDTPRFPRNMMLGAVSNDSLIMEYGKEVGRECREMGIHINFAPVLDLNSNPANPVINTRSFGEDKDEVARKTICYSKGLEANGVMAVGKHFPGHGDTSVDSHLALPVIKHDSTRMFDYELSTFREFINAGLSGMMVAHLSVPSLDKVEGRPSSLSENLVNGVLKRDLGFTGLVFTDGLAMKGVSQENEHCVRALLAGNDILLGPINLEEQVLSVRKAVSDGRIPLNLIEEKCYKVLKYKYILGLYKKQFINTENLIARLNTPNAVKLNRTLHSKAITILKDDNTILPLKRLDEKTITGVSVGESEKEQFLYTLEKYGVDKTIVAVSAKHKDEINNIVRQSRSSNLVVVGIFSDNAADVSLVRNICAGKRFILAFFISPYKMSAYKTLIPEADAVIMAYESSDIAQEYAAQAIYGGIDVNGKLSVSIPGLFTLGCGIDREKVRLGYGVPEQENMSSRVLKKIDKIVEEGMNDEAFPGCQILVAKNGTIIFEKSYGYFDYAKSKSVENDDVYDLASVTKCAATVPAVMKVRDDYKVFMSQKLSKYIPELKGTDKATLTFKEALFHETGMAPSHPFYLMAIDIEGLGEPLYKNTRDVDYRLQVDKKLYANSNYKYLPNLVSDTEHDDFNLCVAENLYVNKVFKDSVFRKLTEIPIKNRGRYKYSCLNFVMLRKAVENISGKQIDKYLDKEIYAPLGIKKMMYNPLRKIQKEKIAPTENDHFLRKQILIGHVHDEIAAFEGGVEGNAGLFANADDLAKLLQLYLNNGEYGGERIFSEETAKLFTMSKSSKSRRGLGFDKPNVQKPQNSPTFLNVPASVYGHTGYTGTCFWIDPDNQLIYIFLTNRVYPNRWNNKLYSNNYRTRIQELLYESIITPKNK
ncbi:MAG: glycoside hydrolase family 3 N-terminal domain-containing protein [Bacteroidales bacterium]|nr:glycoside hydrolase family 3 N-terminal domain-containing protein [Bacteroidales bacterium]